MSGVLGNGNGLDPASAEELRRLVREVLAEVLPARGHETDPAAAGLSADSPPGPGRPPGTVLAAGGVPSGVPAGAGPERRLGAAGGSQEPSGSWEVRIASDADLQEFALRVLKLADNPKQRRDLVAGRIRFRLAGPPEAAGPRAVQRVDKGAVTERTVAAAAAAGARLVLGPRAVLTPLGKDKARALGVPVEKER